MMSGTLLSADPRTPNKNENPYVIQGTFQDEGVLEEVGWRAPRPSASTQILQESFINKVSQTAQGLHFAFQCITQTLLNMRKMSGSYRPSSFHLEYSAPKKV